MSAPEEAPAEPQAHLAEVREQSGSMSRFVFSPFCAFEPDFGHQRARRGGDDHKATLPPGALPRARVPRVPTPSGHQGAFGAENHEVAPVELRVYVAQRH